MLLPETEFLIKEEEEATKAQEDRAKLPRDLLSELSSACTNYRADQIKLAQSCHKALTPPVAACKLAIFPDREGGAECATLAIQVCLIGLTRPDFPLSMLQCMHYCCVVFLGMLVWTI